LTRDGELDRPALRHLIFQSPEKRRALEAILHPLIRDHMEEQALAAVGPYLVLSIPLLVEGGTARGRVDRILVVDADESDQVQRLMIRDSVNAVEARSILAAQASRTERLSAADDVIVNSGSVPELRQAVDRLHQRYLEMASR
jgi:dephospho-CoA kinase